MFPVYGNGNEVLVFFFITSNTIDLECESEDTAYFWKENVSIHSFVKAWVFCILYQFDQLDFYVLAAM